MTIGYIGLGDVGSRFSSGVGTLGVAKVKGIDLKLGLPEFAEKENRCKEGNVVLCKDPEQFMDGCDIVIAATSCAQAIDTLKMYIPYLKPQQLYVDINSAVPEIKQELDKMVRSVGASFCDGGILASPLSAGVKAEVVLSGEKAESLSKTLNECGQNTRFISTTVGRASSLKILRSIFTKGLEALLIETYSSAYHYGVLDEVKKSIFWILTKEPLENMFGRMLRTDVVHSKRRAEEVGAVADMLKDAKMDSKMSQAAFEKLMWASETGSKDFFKGATPEDYMDVVKFYEKIRTDK